MSKRAREGDAAPAGKAKRAKGTPASARAPLSRGTPACSLPPFGRASLSRRGRRRRGLPRRCGGVAWRGLSVRLCREKIGNK